MVCQLHAAVSVAPCSLHEHLLTPPSRISYLAACADHTVPRWLLDDVLPPHSFAQEKGPCRRDSHETNSGTLPPKPPSLYEGASRDIPRIEASKLTLVDFYRNYARTGIPIIITEAFPAPWLEDRRREIGECCRGEHDGNRKRWGAYKAGVLKRGESWNASGTFICAPHCAAKAATMPAELEWIFSSPPDSLLPKGREVFNEDEEVLALQWGGVGVTVHCNGLGYAVIDPWTSMNPC